MEEGQERVSMNAVQERSAEGGGRSTLQHSGQAELWWVGDRKSIYLGGHGVVLHMPSRSSRAPQLCHSPALPAAVHCQKLDQHWLAPVPASGLFMQTLSLLAHGTVTYSPAVDRQQHAGS